ncbi:MAG TPA: response regulator [Methanocella sp.]|nr:response regulator [Methanocella sp.]
MGSKVLVVDDDIDICGLISIALKGKGLEVRTAENGNAGISAFLEFQPDIVLLDHRLPDMTGNDVARKLKATPEGKAACIITMTGTDAFGEEIDMALYSGSLKKPFKLADMVQYVEQHMKK